MSRSKPITLAELTPSLRERFFSFMPDITEGCWEWRGRKNGSGYGELYVPENKAEFGRVTYLAHRVAYTLASEKIIPAGLLICHKCDNWPCCRYDHLFVGTDADNMRDASQKGRLLGRPNTRDKLPWFPGPEPSPRPSPRPPPKPPLEPRVWTPEQRKQNALRRGYPWADQL